MRRFILAIVALLAISATATAQSESFYKFGNRWALGVGGGTEGIGIDVATSINKYFSVRAGVNIMPDISIEEEFDISSVVPSIAGVPVPNNLMIEAEASAKRTTFDVKLDCYPFPNSSSFFITAGASFSGEELITVGGYSDEAKNYIDRIENLGHQYGNELAINIWEDKRIPINRDGHADGGIKVKNFRPYFGLGFGRLIPKKRVGCRLELGVQIHGKPEIYTDIEDFDIKGAMSKDETANDIADIIDKVTVYPVLKFSLRGRIF